MKRFFLLAIAAFTLAGSVCTFAAEALPEADVLISVGKKKGTVAERVRALVADQFGDKAMGAGPETRIIQDLGGDRLDLVLLVMAVEEEFGVAVPDADLGRIETIGDLTDCVRALLAEKRGR